MKVLITGGAGYIGSTVASKLEDSGITPVILDSLIIGKREFTENRIFYKGDISDKKLLHTIFNEQDNIYCTIHCAALIVVPESVVHPYKYYRENVCKSLELFHNLIELNQKRLIFSSSAAIYDAPDGFQVTEDSPLKANCPYSNTKITIENILKDFSHAYNFQVISLRYFNPIGADPQLRSGPYIENPTHILGNLVEVASGRKKVMQINGVNWETRDGSAIRDYVHVWDLANAHLLALKHFDRAFERDEGPYNVINLGTEQGITVKEFVHAFEKVIGKSLEKQETDPRPGDKIGAFASSKKAKELLNWSTNLSIEKGISDALKWDKVRSSIVGY